jgi:Family of unknown function (DUF5395)
VTEPEIVLSCSNGRWRALGLGLALEHRDLRGIESLLEAELASRGVESVAVRFDTSSLPVAFRQYHAHYFNYSLRVPKLASRPSAPA